MKKLVFDFLEISISNRIYSRFSFFISIYRAGYDSYVTFKNFAFSEPGLSLDNSFLRVIQMKLYFRTSAHSKHGRLQ